MKSSPKLTTDSMRILTLALSLTVALGAAGWWLGARPAAPLLTVQPASAATATPPASSNSKAAANGKPGAQEIDGAKNPGLEAEFLELLKLTPKEWPDRLRRAFQLGNQEEIKWLADRWAVRNPASLLAFMQSAEGLGFRIDSWPDWTITQSCFGAWFRRDMAGAMAAMERLTGFDPNMGRMSHGPWQIIFPR